MFLALSAFIRCIYNYICNYYAIFHILQTYTKLHYSRHFINEKTIIFSLIIIIFDS